MASTFDKKFKTTETTKAAGAEVVSDPIELSPRTKNHVLTVTTDSSLSGTVDVEMEMSPDGTNWCPAVSRTVSGGSGTSTGDVIGNEESVKLTPDAGEFKNKHARGGLNFDVNGAVVTPDGSGARDLMHQHIEVNKSFNYSQWFKTSENPTTTYKPVLFRHGGYDDFENAKTVELNDTTTVAVPSKSFQGYGKVGSSTTGNFAYNTTQNPYASSGTSVPQKRTIAFWVATGTSSPSVNFTHYLYIEQFGGGAAIAVSLRRTASGGMFFQVSEWDGTNFEAINTPNGLVQPNTWLHVVVSLDGGSTGTTNAGVKNCTISINGQTQPMSTFNAGAVTGNTSVSFSNVGFQATQGSSAISGLEYIEIDEFSIFEGGVTTAPFPNTHQFIQDLYNSGSRVDPTTISLPTGVTLKRYLKIGEDDDSVDLFKSYAGITGDFFVKHSSATSASLVTNSSSDPTYYTYNQNQPTTQNLCEGASLPFASIFTTTSNLSISGWFKTTATGTLFSNTDGASATDGMKLEVNASNVVLTLIDSSQTITAATNVRDGEWHHLLVTKPSGTTPTIKIYIDGSESVSTTVTTISNDDLKGSNGFTLLGDGKDNANAASPAATDLSKLQASISNWSLHSEVLDANAVKQLYSNGHVRNVKNLPSVTASAIEAWWQLADTTNPENDLVGTNHLQYQDGASQTLLSQQVNADGATLVEDTINGNALTLSLTKSFNFTTNEWVATADQDTALCLSFNGFEEQAEYFALWKCSQTIGGGPIDICDGDWHNVILSYRGRNDLAGNNVAEGDTVKFGPGPANSLAFNWAMSYDGQPLTALNDGSGADYIGGNNAIATDTYNSVSYNVGFNIYNRHLKYETSNTEEVYKPHAQFSAGIHEVSGVDNNNAFQGYVDETSFHSDTWWVDQAGTSVVTNTFNQEKPATIYGNTTALDNRQGASTEYPEGKPYPLLNPEKLTTSGQASDIEGTNQYINPNRYDSASNPNGGLEGWWRWGDTAGDCSITINDVRDHEASINARDIDAFGIVTADRQVMTSADSIFLADSTGSIGGGGTITFPQVKIEGIQQGICNLANINSPLLQYVRVKIKGAGSMDLGEGKGQARLNYTNRIRRRNK